MHEVLQWRSPAECPRLTETSVHVWRCDLGTAPSCEIAWLGPDERARLRHIRDPGARDRFLAARRFVRRTLASYLGIGPEHVPLTIAPGGKPRLAATTSALHFNLSHTRELALLAVARHPVGIDVESLRRVPRCLDIARRVWPVEWCDTLVDLEEPARSTRFLRLWTQFEAQQKAGGQGVFSEPADVPPAQPFSPDADHVAALAWTCAAPPDDVIGVADDVGS